MENRNASVDSSESHSAGPIKFNGADAVIVSAYGRGNWLATELASRGWDVTLNDVSESLGPWDPEDVEGPFGFLESADLHSSQKTHLIAEGETRSVASGFTIWLERGAIECRSELTNHQLRSHEIPKEIETYLRLPGLPNRDSQRHQRKVLRLPFRQAWLAHFAHQLASPTKEENHRALREGDPLPIFSPFIMRQPTSDGLRRGLLACQKAGVKVRMRSAVEDIRLEGRLVDAIEIQDNQSGIERGRTFIWMLSSNETERSAKKVFSMLYPRGAVLPEWYWARFRIDFRGAAADDQLPVHVVLVEDPFLPWTHTNVTVLRKRTAAKAYDAWIRLPVRVRFDSVYLRGVARELELVLSRRFPSFEPHTSALPIETRFSERELGAAKFSICRNGDRENLAQLKAGNFFFCGPEQWSTLDWLGQFRKQNELLLRLEKMRMQWLAKERAQYQRASQSRSASP